MANNEKNQRWNFMENLSENFSIWIYEVFFSYLIFLNILKIWNSKAFEN